MQLYNYEFHTNLAEHFFLLFMVKQKKNPGNLWKNCAEKISMSTRNAFAVLQQLLLTESNPSLLAGYNLRQENDLLRYWNWLGIVKEA